MEEVAFRGAKLQQVSPNLHEMTVYERPRVPKTPLFAPIHAKMEPKTRSFFPQTPYIAFTNRHLMQKAPNFLRGGKVFSFIGGASG